MIHTFKPLRAGRFVVQLKEISIGDSISVLSMSPGEYEAETTAFLRAALKSVDGPKDPADWTVEERILAVCHYLAATLEKPDFDVQGGGNFSDYLVNLGETSIPDHAELGEIAGDRWSVYPLTGRMAETIEGLQGELKDTAGKPVPPRLHWLLGAMAAQLLREGETVTPPESPSYESFLLERMRILRELPESAFIELFTAFAKGRDSISRFFVTRFDGSGVIVCAKEGADLPPARFPSRSCLSDFAAQLV